MKDKAIAEQTQDVRVRDVPVELARRWKAALGIRGLTVRTWFIETAGAGSKSVRMQDARRQKSRGRRVMSEVENLEAALRTRIESILRANGGAIPPDFDAMLFNSEGILDDMGVSALARWLRCLDREVLGQIREHAWRILEGKE